MVTIIITYHAVGRSYRASPTGRWSLLCSIQWVLGPLEVAHSMTEDPHRRGYRPTRLSGQWQLQSIGRISNNNERWPVDSPGAKGQDRVVLQHSNKQQASASPMGCTAAIKEQTNTPKPLFVVLGNIFSEGGFSFFFF